jgi:hypothetical protein
MSNSDDNDDYDVGYKKPPKKTRFRKGQSGNPKGRPKETIDMQTSMDKVMNRKISVTEQGIERTITVAEAILTRLASDALKRDVRAAKLLFDKWMALNPVSENEKDAPELNLILNGIKMPASFAARDKNIQQLNDESKDEDQEEDDSSNKKKSDC